MNGGPRLSRDGNEEPAGPDTPNSDQIRAYYDHFLRERMVNYRLFDNARIDRAVQRVIPLLRPADRVLEVGCGIGIVSERVASHVPEGEVIGTDLSPENIWYATRTIRLPNVSFLTCDAQMDFEEVRTLFSGPPDVILMIDVIEHIPESERPELLRRLRSLQGENGTLVLTYPSPQYQRHLMAVDRDKLQVTDFVIELHVLVDEAAAAGYSLRHYSLEDVWMANQYCHVIFQTNASLARPKNSRAATISQRIARRFRNSVYLPLVVPYRRWKYVTSVFRDRRPSVVGPTLPASASSDPSTVPEDGGMELSRRD
jgi:2-polyprenyl-3-methyl-5-hydroxy-6-metoxy-1,4-benzoquinol methylase